MMYSKHQSSTQSYELKPNTQNFLSPHHKQRMPECASLESTYVSPFASPIPTPRVSPIDVSKDIDAVPS
jgi:hypothetical protein